MRKPRKSNDEIAFNLVAGKQLRRARILAGMPQDEIAKRMGISFQQIQKYESGKNAPSIFKLIKLCEILQLNMESFIVSAAEKSGIILAKESQKDKIDYLENEPRQTLQIIAILNKLSPDIFSSIVSLLKTLARENSNENAA